MLIESVTILGGCGRNGELEPIERTELKMGDVVSIVGPTGSGKTTLINDIELLADKNRGGVLLLKMCRDLSDLEQLLR